jgi:Rhodopirellula transposase DDE domain
VQRISLVISTHASIPPQSPTLPEAGQPVISVDTKKKELVGDLKNGGRELWPKGDPEQVRVHDFVIPELGRVTPYAMASTMWARIEAG